MSNKVEFRCGCGFTYLYDGHDIEGIRMVDKLMQEHKNCNYISEVKKLRLKPDDVLIIKVGSPDPDSPYHTVNKAILDSVAKLFSEHKESIGWDNHLVVITHAYDFTAISKEDFK